MGRNLIGSRIRLQFLPVLIQGMFHTSLMFVFVVCLEKYKYLITQYMILTIYYPLVKRQWDPAYELFNEMKNDGIHPDLVAYNALIGAGMAADKPTEVYDVWREMCDQSNNQKGSKVSPDIVTLTEVIATLDSAAGKVKGVKANREWVDEVFAEAVDRGLILRKDSLDTTWEVDLSCMSFPILGQLVGIFLGK